MNKTLMLAVTTGVLAAGCARDADKVSQPAPVPEPAVAAQPEAKSLDTVVVSVDGKELTEADIQLELTFRMAAIKPPPPPDRMEQMRTRMRSAVIGQFVTRTLLLDEAQRRGIEVTPEDEASAFEKIRANLPEGKTLEEVLAASAVGEDKMREEVLVGIRINKLIDAEIIPKLAVTDEELDRFMEENMERLAKPEQVQARHILIAVQPDADDEAKAAARETMDGIRQQLVDGADFAALAQEHSSCPSKEKGGDLGYFGRGQMAKPFEEAAFSQEIDAIGPVVETRFGYHIVQVVDKQEAGVMGRDDIRPMFENRKRQQLMREYIEGLRENATITQAE